MDLKIENGIAEVVVTTVYLTGGQARVRGRSRGTTRTVPFRAGEMSRTCHQEAAVVTALAEMEKGGFPDAEVVKVEQMSDPYGYRFRVACRIR